MRTSIFGLGYVGSVSAACFAAMGHDVIGVDIAKEKIDSINSGMAPIFEKGLDESIKQVLDKKRLFATDDCDFAVKNSEMSLLCVGTPSLPSGATDLAYVRKVCEEIGYSLELKNHYHVVVIRSTIPPGTIQDILIPLIEQCSGKSAGKGFGIAMNPEFLREGSAIDDFYNPERIIIGAYDEQSFEAVSRLYETTSNCKVNAPIYKVPIKSAEICKYVDNTFHALKVVFANEIGVIAKDLGVDSQELMSIFCKDKKLNISPYYFRPGFSFGGSCLPKDLKGLNQIARELGIEAPLLSSIQISNEIHANRALELIKKTNRKSFGFLGLTFKENTDDLRGNPIISVIDKLSDDPCYELYLYDSLIEIGDLFDKKNVKVVSEIEEIIDKVEILVLSNNSKEYMEIAIESNKVIIDLNKALPDQIATLSLV